MGRRSVILVRQITQEPSNAQSPTCAPGLSTASYPPRIAIVAQSPPSSLSHRKIYESSIGRYAGQYKLNVNMYIFIAIVFLFLFGISE